MSATLEWLILLAFVTVGNSWMAGETYCFGCVRALRALRARLINPRAFYASSFFLFFSKSSPRNPTPHPPRTCHPSLRSATRHTHRACSGIGKCNERGHCACPEGYTGVDCAEGLPLDRSPEVDRRLSRERAATDYFDAVHLHDDVEAPTPGEAALYTGGGGADASEEQRTCATLWGKCRKGQASSPRIFIYTLPGPMVGNPAVLLRRPHPSLSSALILSHHQRTIELNARVATPLR